MKKKRGIILLVVVIVILSLILGINHLYEMNIIDENSKIGSIEKSKYKELESLNEKDNDLSFTTFIENKYYVVMSENDRFNKVVYNKSELDNFLKNVNMNICDEIRIVQYTDRNEEPVIINIKYTKDKYIIKVDNRWNSSCSKEEKKIVVKEYNAKNYRLIRDQFSNKIVYSKVFSKINLISNDNIQQMFICDYLETESNVKNKFKLEFTKTSSKKREVVLLKSENNKYDYDIYTYNGFVDVIIEGAKMSLRKALLTDQIRVEEIFEKINKDVNEDKRILRLYFLDGGSATYIYDNYAILKFNTLSNNRDLYIGNPSMDINEIVSFYR